MNKKTEEAIERLKNPAPGFRLVSSGFVCRKHHPEHPEVRCELYENHEPPCQGTLKTSVSW